MPVESYAGVPGVAVDVQSEQDVYDALDAMHSQTLDQQGNVLESMATVNGWLSQALDRFAQDFDVEV